jgi:carbon monoxide dehydrogenase subunit G
MSFSVEASIIINAPVAEVFDWMDHPRKHHDWQHSLLDTTVHDDNSFTVGRKFLGRRIETHFHQVEKAPNKLLRRTGKGGIGMLMNYTVNQRAEFEDVNGATKVTITSEVDTRGALKAAATKSMQRAAMNEVEVNLKYLKELVEAEKELHEFLGQLPRHNGA